MVLQTIAAFLGGDTLDILALFISIAICGLAGAIGAVFTYRRIPNWYASLDKPSFSPPNWLFGPVWTLLYLLMGIAAYLIWREGTDNPAVMSALVVFGVQLFLNVLWPAVFFGLKTLSGGLIVITLLWLAILITILRFLSFSLAAALLLLPYIAWVTFAAVLNVALFVMNRR